MPSDRISLDSSRSPASGAPRRARPQRSRSIWLQSVRPGLLACAVLLLTACAGPVSGPVPVPPADPRGIDLDAATQDLIFTLTQLDTLKPITTTVQLSTPSGELGQHLEQRLRDAGYGLQRVSADQGLNHLRYRSTLVSNELGEHRSVRISIGQTAITRDYALVDGVTVPISAQRLVGVPEQPVQLIADLFDVARSQDVQRVAFAAPGIEDEQALVVLARPARQPAGDGQFSERVRSNMHETLRSNYAQVFSSYDDVKRTILVFPNDSRQLGEQNKRVIAEYARSMNLDTDVLSVIGCSHGRSALEDGNKLLANGRAERVKEAFLFSGIPSALVLEEGCWAGEHFDEKMPRRGVVLTHKRRLG